MICLWCPPLHCRHICSSGSDWRSFFLIPLRVFCSNLRPFQQDSISCVWTPVTGSTKWRACTTIRCAATLFIRRAMPLYAAQSSVQTSFPGRIHIEIMGSSVAMSRLSTTWKYPRAGLNSVVTMPKTQASLALLPRLYWKEAYTLVTGENWLFRDHDIYYCGINVFWDTLQEPSQSNI